MDEKLKVSVTRFSFYHLEISMAILQKLTNRLQWCKMKMNHIKLKLIQTFAHLRHRSVYLDTRNANKLPISSFVRSSISYCFFTFLELVSMLSIFISVFCILPSRYFQFFTSYSQRCWWVRWWWWALAAENWNSREQQFSQFQSLISQSLEYFSFQIIQIINKFERESKQLRKVQFLIIN